jgi:hypothetical protein
MLFVFLEWALDSTDADSTLPPFRHTNNCAEAPTFEASKPCGILFDPSRALNPCLIGCLLGAHV